MGAGFVVEAIDPAGRTELSAGVMAVLGFFAVVPFGEVLFSSVLVALLVVLMSSLLTVCEVFGAVVASDDVSALLPHPTKRQISSAIRSNNKSDKRFMAFFLCFDGAFLYYTPYEAFCKEKKGIAAKRSLCGLDISLCRVQAR